MTYAVFNQPIGALRQALLANDTSVLDVTQAHLQRIEQTQAELAGFTCVLQDTAIQAAMAYDAQLADAAATGYVPGPLFGVPISIKDTIDVAGVPTTACSHSQLHASAEQDAALVVKLRQAGAIIIGKANCHEFAFGGPAFDLPFPPARNPWDPQMFPGGSSSGSGVTVASGGAMASIGTDTAGSIRLPSTHCGLVGMKPSYGLVSLAGIRPLSLSMDHAGPLATRVDDCRAVYQAIVDAPDTPVNSFRVTANRHAWRNGDFRGLRVAIPHQLWGQQARIDAPAMAAYQQAIDVFQAQGAEVLEVIPPSLEELHAAASIIMMAEVARIFAPRVRADFDRFGEVFRNRVLVGENISADAYLGASQQRLTIGRQMMTLLQSADVFMLPGSLSVAGPLRTVDKFYFLKDPNLNVVANFTGQPALALPVTHAPQGIPTGIQLIGAHYGEDTLFDIGEGLEALLHFAESSFMPTR
ncbi:MAG: amidase [Burkholderiaceae bacterium]|nr:amidase [Burkholderiaceae bacterium]